MPFSSGAQTSDIFRWGPEAHKLHLEFGLQGDVFKGQLVKMYTDGKVTALADGDAEYLCVGISIHDNGSPYDSDYGVMAVRGYTVIMAQASAALNAGPVESGGFDEATSRQIVTTASDAGHTIGWALDVAGDAGDIIRVLIKD
jgi:hypothetical protein